MTCHPFRLPDGTSGFVCTRGKSRAAKCFYCRTPHERLCDHEIAPGKTCNRKLCPKHAHHAGEDRDLCPDHYAPPTIVNDAKPRLQFLTGVVHEHRKNPDALDITIMSGGADGRPFAPSMGIFKPARQALEEAERLRMRAQLHEHTEPMRMGELLGEAERIESAAWVVYRRAYLAEMIVSSGRDAPEGWERDVMAAKSRGVVPHVEAWQAELAKERRIYTCYCKADKRTRCHAGLLAQVLQRLGATYLG